MGLDTVELVMELEDIFEITIPDADAERMATPGEVADWLVEKLGDRHLTRTKGCHSQRMFHRIRSGLVEQFQIPRAKVRLQAKIDELIPESAPRNRWRQFARDYNLERPRFRFFQERFASSGTTVRNLVDQAVSRDATCLLDVEGNVDRQLVLGRVMQVVSEQMNLPLADFSEHSRFIQDLGMG